MVPGRESNNKLMLLYFRRILHNNREDTPNYTPVGTMQPTCQLSSG